MLRVVSISVIRRATCYALARVVIRSRTLFGVQLRFFTHIAPRASVSIILPVPLAALALLSSRRSVIDGFRANKQMIGTTVTATAMILVLNAVLVWQVFSS